MNEKLAQITAGLESLSADLAQMLAQVASLQQAVNSIMQSTPEPPTGYAAEPHLPEVPDETPAAGSPEEEEEMPSRDLRRLFTVNDLYRFRRELFGNSDSDMADTINLLSAMNSMAEVEDYVYDDLGWSHDNDEVVDFMTIVGRAFGRRAY